MKSFLKWPLYVACGLVMTGSLVSCDDDDDDVDPSSLNQKEATFKSLLTPYVDKTIILTYHQMADQAVELSKVCKEMEESYGNVTKAQVEKAGNYWKESRRHWEESEAFLFGAAGDYNIDPHIDSWPLDKNAMDAQLKLLANPDYEWNIDNNAGYGLLGFHAVEYLLFELSADGKTSLVHNTNYTLPELRYLSTVAEDLRNQCVRLEAAWAGLENVSEEKQNILAEAELEPTIDYGWSMKNAGKGGSLYKTYQAAVEDLIQGAADIADEVGSTKINTPVNGSSEEDKNFIESPYSLNSITDFAGNIISIQYAYCGYEKGDACLSDYVKSVNPDLDAKLVAQIEKTIKTIKEIPEPFALNTKHPSAQKSIDECGVLVELLGELAEVVSEQ